VVAVHCFPAIAIGVVEERAQVAVGANANVSAAAAVAAVGAAHGNELLAAEGDDPRAAVASLYTNNNAIDEHEIRG
jgi:hypothetical protein